MVCLLAAQGFGQPPQTDWPRKIILPEAQITVYQPELEEFKGTTLRARAVVAVQQPGKTEPVFGVVWFSSRLDIDREEDTARPAQTSVSKLRFPNAKEESLNRLKSILEKSVPTWDLTLSVDQLVASMTQLQGIRVESEKLNNAPPRIIFAKQPSVLVLFDGEPLFRNVEGSNLRAAANTPYPVAQNMADGRYYLAVGRFWYRASGAKGPWEATTDVPQAVRSALTKVDENTEDEPDEEEKGPPTIIVATEPAELISTDGEPKFAPVEGGALLYVTNTESDVLLEVESQEYFVLLSGRWYFADSLDGPWTFVEPENLPAAFSEIREDSVVAHLRDSIAGTPEAKEAVLDAYVPQTSAVKRTATTEVSYDGEPKFESIPGIKLLYAVNSASTVLKSGGTYYVCDQGVWYESSKPTGPWKAATKRPAGVEKIPPESPVENVKYVYIYDSTPQVVYMGYTPGYIGTRIYHGTVVFGTGYVYQPWVGAIYYPRPVTWGFRISYHPWSGWSFGVGVRYGGFGFTFFHGGSPFYRPPYMGGWWGPGGYRPPFYRPPYYRPPGYRPPRPPRPTPYRPQTRDNIYGRPQNQPNVPSRLPASPQPAVQPAGGPNNLLSDRDGNIYRPTQNGWQVNDRAGWTNVPGSGAPAQLPSASPSTRPSTLPSSPNVRPAPTPRPSVRPTPGARPSAPQTPSRLPTARPAPTPAPNPSRPTPSRTDLLRQREASRARGAARTQQSRQNRPAPGRRR